MYNKIKNSPTIGDVYMIKFGENSSGSVQGGWRPGVIFQNNTGNVHSPNVVALPLTSSLKKVNQPTHVLINASEWLPKDSMVLCENPECIPKNRIGDYMGRLSEENMREISGAYLLSSSCIAFLDIQAIMTLKRRAVELNAVA